MIHLTMSQDLCFSINYFDILSMTINDTIKKEIVEKMTGLKLYEKRLFDNILILYIYSLPTSCVASWELQHNCECIISFRLNSTLSLLDLRGIRNV